MNGNSLTPIQTLYPQEIPTSNLEWEFSIPQNTITTQQNLNQLSQTIPQNIWHFNTYPSHQWQVILPQTSQKSLQQNSNEIIAPIPIVISPNTQYQQTIQSSTPQSTLVPIVPQQPQFQQNTPQNPPQITTVPQIPQPEVQPIHHNNVIQTPPQISNNITPTSPIFLPSSPQNIDEEIPEDLSLEEKKKITQEIIDKYTDGLSVKDLDEEGLNNLIDMFLLPEEERNEKRAEIEKERDKIQIEMEEIMKDADELKWILDEAVNYVATNKRQLRGLDNDVQELKELNEFDIDSQLANV